jgi:hypothetical protein
MSAAGTVILFVTTLAYLALVSTFVLAFAAHCYLVVLQATSAGQDRVAWPDEPIYDWLGRAAYLGGLALLWLAPAGALSRALRHEWLPDAAALRFLLLAVPGLWLLFPVGLLATLGGTSRGAALRPGALWQLLRLFPSLCVFYLCTGALLAAGAALWHVALFTKGLYLLPVAAVAGGAVVLLHARLLGRIAWLVQGVEAPGRARAAKPAPRRVKKGRRKEREPEVRDPWAEPLEERGPSAPSLPVEGYGVAAENEPAQVPDFWSKPAKKRKPKPVKEAPAAPVSLPVDGYEVADEPAAAAPPAVARSGPVSAEAVAKELEMRDRSPADPPPALPLFSGVWTFPFYESSLKAWLWLALGGVAVGVGVRGVVANWPF